MTTICMVKDNEHQVVSVATNWRVAADILANAHNEAVTNGAKPNEEFIDSLSGYHCSIWSENGESLAVYGEEGSQLCEDVILSAEEIEEDMFKILNIERNK